MNYALPGTTVDRLVTEFKIRYRAISSAGLPRGLKPPKGTITCIHPIKLIITIIKIK